MNIIASYDTSLSRLNNDGSAADQATYNGYTSAIATAVNYYDTVLTNPITVTIEFGWGEDRGLAIPSGDLATGGPMTGTTYSWSQVYGALVNEDAYGSAVQQAALATLSASNPTGNGVFYVGQAQAKALGLSLTGVSGTDGSVGLSSAYGYSWSQAGVAAGSFDAVGILEHEITHALGRIDSTTAVFGTYSLLDLFHYAAANGLATDAIGAAAGVRDIAGQLPGLASYFSYNGTTVTLPFETPAEAVGGDPADWNVSNDSYGYAAPGVALPVSITDLEEMSVLGFDGSSGILYSPANTVQTIYQAVLNRAPGLAEIAGDAAALNAGLSALALQVAAATSGEAQSDISARYNAVLGRAADAVGMAGWEITLAKGAASMSAVQPTLAASGEAAGDIGMIYQNVLGRVADAGGVAAYQGALGQSGGSLSAVQASLATSREAVADIGAIYQQVLGRTADAAGLGNWETVLSQSGGMMAAVRNDLVLSSEGVNKLTAALATMEGHAPSAADITAGQVELGSGLSLTDLSTQNLMLASGPTFINGTGGTLKATAGVDVFVFGPGNFGVNTITGFSATKDILEFSRTQFANVAAVQAAETSTASGVQIALSASNSVSLQGFAASGLVNANLRFV